MKWEGKAVWIRAFRQRWISIVVLAGAVLIAGAEPYALPSQSKTVLSMIQRQVGTVGKYNVVILFDLKVFNYALASMQVAIQMLKAAKFTGPIIVLYRSIRRYLDQQLIQQYKAMKVPIVVDTFGVFRELNIAPRIMPTLTIWDSAGVLRAVHSLGGFMEPSFYARLVDRLDSLKPIPLSRLPQHVVDSVRDRRIWDRVTETLQALPVLTPYRVIELQDDSVLCVGRLRMPKVSNSGQWMSLGDFDRERIRIYDLQTGKQIAEIAATRQRQQELSGMNLDSLWKIVPMLGVLTRFTYLCDFLPNSDTLVTYEFYTVVDSLQVQGEDSILQLNKKYVLGIYPPPWNQTQKYVLMQVTGLGWGGAIKAPCVTPWRTVLFPYQNWEQVRYIEHSTNSLPSELDPKSDSVATHSPLFWEFDLRTGAFRGYQGRLSIYRKNLGIGYLYSVPVVDCNHQDCAYTNVFADSVTFLRSSQQFPLKTYYSEAFLRMAKTKDTVLSPDEFVQWMTFYPVEIALSDTRLSIVWYNTQTRRAIWQVYGLSPFQLRYEFALSEPILSRDIGKEARYALSTDLRLYRIEQDELRTVVSEFRLPEE